MKPNPQIIEAILAADEKMVPITFVSARAAKDDCLITYRFEPRTALIGDVKTFIELSSQAPAQLRALLAENERLEAEYQAKDKAFQIASDQAIANGHAYQQQRTELRAALYPGGCKHPQQGEWQWLIEQVKEQRAVMAQARDALASVKRGVGPSGELDQTLASLKTALGDV